MKVLVFSDSHGQSGLMEQVIRFYGGEAGVECALFLGDCLSDFIKLRHLFPRVEFFGVPGNCDYYTKRPNQPDEFLLTLGGAKILLAHGHKHGVKSGYERIANAAAQNGANACFFGHSHVPVLMEKNGITLLNPGSITEPRGGNLGKSYAALEILDGVINAQIYDTVSIK